MSFTYSPNTNSVANIQNRRGMTKMVENLRVLNDFDNLVRTPQEYGDTIEHVMTALSEKEAYDPKATQAGKYKDTVLNKIYNVINWSNVYYASTPQEEYKKALKDPSALANLVSSVTGKQTKTWKYDQYNEFVSMFESDTFTTDTEVENFSDFDTITKDERDEKIEKFLQQLSETVIKMGFYSNDYIKVDTALTTAQKARMIATAPAGDLTIYLNAKYFSWSQVDLSKRFRNFLDINKNVKLKIINFTDADKIGYIAHDLRYQFVPKMIVADEAKPFGVMRTDHALIVEGTFATVPLFPATLLKAKTLVE